ncbi:MAG: metalloregulator ArsR/SmtB family transcription factor [Pseudomonadota bacterium]
MTPDSLDLNPVAEEATELLKALAHPARLMICCQLRDREMSVGDIESTLEIRQPRLSRELAKLREEGLVETRRESKVIYYRLADKPRVRPMVDAICAVMLGKPTDALRDINALPPVKSHRSGGYGVFARTVPPPKTTGA